MAKRTTTKTKVDAPKTRSIDAFTQLLPLLTEWLKEDIKSTQVSAKSRKTQTEWGEKAVNAMLKYMSDSEERRKKLEAPPLDIKRFGAFHPTGAPNMATVIPFTDARGTIANIAEHDVGGVQVIVSKGGSTRAKHIHRTDTHICYVVSGSLRYIEKGAKNRVDAPLPIPDPESPAQVYTYKTGDRFVTGPLVAHQMDFLEDTVMVVLSENPRDAVSYDADIVKFTESLEVPN